MTRFPFVSIIIPNYCHSEYLEQRIESVLNQTYQNFEVIILDDCSPDNGLSKSVINKYKENPKISNIVFNTFNSGSTFLQWKKGLDLAKGDLVWIAESDDFCDLNMLSELVNQHIKFSDSVITYTSYKLVDENGCSIQRKSKHEKFLNFCRRLNMCYHCSGEAYITRYLSLGNIIENASTAIFDRKTALGQNADYLNFPGAGDYLFWVKIAEKGSVSIVNKELSSFRRHTNCVTNKRDLDGSNFTANKHIIEYILKHHNISPLRKRIIYFHQLQRITNLVTLDKELQSTLLNLWNKEYRFNRIDSLIYGFLSIIRGIFNYYI